MAEIMLKAKKRTIFGKRLTRERREGQLPAIVYGKAVASQPLFLAREEFAKVFSRAGANTIVKLEIEDPESGKKETRSVLIHDVTREPVTGKPIHADFYQIRTDEKVRVAVPLVFSGESAAVKTEGGILVKAMQEIKVEAFPPHLPHELTVDISSLNTFEDKIYVKNLAVPENVTVISDPGAIVALVQPPRSEEELKALTEKPVEAVEEVKVETEEKKAEAAAEVQAEAPAPQQPKPANG